MRTPLALALAAASIGLLAVLAAPMSAYLIVVPVVLVVTFSLTAGWRN